MLKEYYNNIATYLMDTFGANFILLIILFSTVMSIVYFIMISYLITQLDTRYFIDKNLSNKTDNEIKNETKSVNNNRARPHLILMNGSVSLVVNTLKIFVGVVLLLCGIAMLVLPGQGLLTILIGLSLIPFPGKKKIEQNILARKSVRFSLNWIRTKAKKEPFIFD